MANRDHLVTYLRKTISNILNNWYKSNSDFYQTYLSKKSNYYTFNHYGIKNKRRTMEDKVCIYVDLNMFFNGNSKYLNKQHSLFALFDGHSGIEAVNYVSAHLALNLIKHESYETNINKAINETFHLLNKRLLMKSEVEVRK